MIASFFQNLRRRNAEYLLISGQAAVLYGAATFSEDIDLGIDPSQENLNRFTAALRDCRARYYKLTPEFTIEKLRCGHGFHFLLPCGGEGDVFLDVMGVPPRAGSFSAALAGARWMETEWGILRIIGLQALAELKKTQRLEDDPIISRLAVAWFEQAECAKAVDDFRWAIRNIFTIPELRMLFEEHPRAIDLLLSEFPPELKDFAQRIRAGTEIPEATVGHITEGMQRRMAELEQADRLYWRDIIADLKQIRAAGKLMAEGAEV